jgi:hypothetical protein
MMRNPLSKSVLAVLVVLGVQACSSDSGTTTDPNPPPVNPPPNVAGIWRYEAPALRGTIAGAPGECRAFDGIVTLVQAPGSYEFSGTYSGLRLNCFAQGSGGTWSFGPFDGDVIRGMVDDDSNLAFAFDVNAWLHFGYMDPARILGTAVVDLTVDNEEVTFAGTFSMMP